MRFIHMVTVLGALVALSACRSKSPDELCREGQAALDAGKKDQAIRLFQAALKKSPDHEESNYRLGRIYLDQNQDKLAVKHLERVVASHPGNAKAQFRLGEAYLGVHQNDKAVEALVQAIHLDQKAGGPYLKLAKALRRLGRESEAQRVLRTGLERVPRTDPFYEEIAKEAGTR